MKDNKKLIRPKELFNYHLSDSIVNKIDLNKSIQHLNLEQETISIDVGDGTVLVFWCNDTGSVSRFNKSYINLLKGKGEDNNV